MKSSVLIQPGEKVDQLSSEIDRILLDIISPEHKSFALLDFPNHGNIGDSAIYLGEIEYLSKRGLTPSYVSTTRDIDWSDLDDAIGEGPIYLHGGGNFGDLWPTFQNFREEVMGRYKGRPVVQFPQTLHFIEQSAIDQAARCIETHGAFILLVRDQKSFDLASKHFQCDVRLCPDMALRLGPLKRGAPEYELLLHLREDVEAAGAYDSSSWDLLRGVTRADWPAERKWFRRGMKLQALCDLPSLAGPARRRVMRERIYRLAAAQRFARGRKLLESARLVITDRLHGHIMSLLFGIPQCVLDNSYGKLSGFMDAWEGPVAHIHRASSLAQAVELLQAEEGLDLGVATAR